MRFYLDMVVVVFLIIGVVGFHERAKENEKKKRMKWAVFYTCFYVLDSFLLALHIVAGLRG